MIQVKNFSALLLFLMFAGGSQSLYSQTKASIFDGKTDIYWLGMDFSQANFIGSATQFKDAGEITNEDFRDKYAVGWNQLFINEQEKYDVAAAVHRTEVQYAMEVTEMANSKIKKDFFTNNPSDFTALTEQKVIELVQNYDFMGKKGIGMMFFVGGMSKSKESANAYVTFVNMETREVLLVRFLTGEAGGFGFKNYWARCFFNILEQTKDNYKKWK